MRRDAMPSWSRLAPSYKRRAWSRLSRGRFPCARRDLPLIWGPSYPRHLQARPAPWSGAGWSYGESSGGVTPAWQTPRGRLRNLELGAVVGPKARLSR